RRHPGQSQPLFPAEHPADPEDRDEEAGNDEQVGLLLVEQDRRQDREGRPQVIDHADFDGLPAAVGVADGQRKAQLVRDEQQAAPDEIASGELPYPRKADREQQHYRCDAVHHGGAAGRAEALTDAPDQADDRAPQDNCNEPDERRSTLVFHAALLTFNIRLKDRPWPMAFGSDRGARIPAQWIVLSHPRSRTDPASRANICVASEAFAIAPERLLR